MEASPSFEAGLEFVLGVLRERRDSGRSLKASADSLVHLQEQVKARKMARGSGEAREKSVGESAEKRPALRETRGAIGAEVAVRMERQEPIQVTRVSATENAVPLFTGDKREALAVLRVEAAGCQRCPNLVRSRFSVVFGEGDPEAELMFVGEAPGAEEDQRGEPFVGAAGELLEKMIVGMGLSRSGVYIANVLKCRPDVPEGVPGNRKPAADEMERCLPFLRRQIEIVRPRVMVALGATAMQGLFGRTEPMARLRAQWHDFGGIPVMATYHPSYLLRNQAASEKRKVWEDLLQVMDRLGLPISDKQRSYFLPKKG